MNIKIITYAALHALGTALYIGVVASFFFYAPKIFHTENTPDTVFAPIFVLALFVFSAALTSFLMLGRPVLWFLDGKRKEAIALLMWTLGMFFAITLALFLTLVSQ